MAQTRPLESRLPDASRPRSGENASAWMASVWLSNSTISFAGMTRSINGYPKQYSLLGHFLHLRDRCHLGESDQHAFAVSPDPRAHGGHHVVLACRVRVPQVVQVRVLQLEKRRVEPHQPAQADEGACKIDHDLLIEQLVE